jgi:hypothetical protein
MNFKKRIILLLSFVVITANLFAQKKQKDADTAAMLKDFTKIMAFSKEPYIYYDAIIKMQSVPILQEQDTMQLKAVFYKKDKDLFISNSIEETYIQDSFEIEINNDRKTIWISKVNAESENNFNIFPLSDKEFKNMLRNKYVISQSEIDKGNTRINFETNQQYDSISNLKISLGVYYDNKKYLPTILEMDIASKQQISEENVEVLKRQGTSIKDLLKMEEDVIFMVRSQKMTMNFLQIDNNKVNPKEMPSWKSILEYNAQEDEFTIKNEKYSNYEITKTY